MTETNPVDGDAIVAAQYAALPYPARDPKDEATRLIVGSPSNLAELDHYVFAGARDWSQPFRALVAGGGTGDALVMLAQQLADRGTPSELVYLDLSQASQRIAEARIAARGLSRHPQVHVRFLSGSLLAASTLAPGPFDYIDCCGVLHHLADSSAGLAALKAVLSPDGGMGLMVYGTLGRIGVYHAQALVDLLADGPEQSAPAPRLAFGKRLLRALPSSNWLRRNPFLSDPAKAPDAELFDTYLHGRDRSFTIPELFDWVDGAGLAVSGFVLPARYDPNTWVSDPVLRARLARLAWRERAAAAELLAGSLKTHAFYVVPAAREKAAGARLTHARMIPVPIGIDTAALARSIARDSVVRATLDGVPCVWPLPRAAPAVLSRIDGSRTIAAIAKVLASEDPGGQWTEAKVLEVAEPLFQALHGLGKLMLREGREV